MSSNASLALLSRAAAALGEVTKAPVRDFSTRDFGRKIFPEARSVLVPAEAAAGLLVRLRAVLPSGTVAFVGVTNSLAKPEPAGVELVVAVAESQFDILRVAASDAINFGLKTEDLIRELETWHAEFGIDIWQAETDTIQLRFKSLPKDIKAFAARVYKFCPDIVDQGSDSVDELETAITTTGELCLWWD